MFSNKMIYLARMPVHRTVSCFRYFPLTQPRADGQSWLWIFRNLTQDCTRYTKTAGGKSNGLLWNTKSLTWPSQQTYHGCVSLCESRYNVNYVQSNTYHRSTNRHFSGQSRRQQRRNETKESDLQKTETNREAEIQKTEGNKEINVQNKEVDIDGEVPAKKLTLIQRFRKTYQENGTILLCVHVATSSVWYGCFFFAAQSGIDVVPLLQWMGVGEMIINPFKSGAGDAAVAYLLYKLASPARYTVTIGGTNYVIKYLRKTGRMPVVKKEDTLRNLAREAGETEKEKVKTRLKAARNRQRNKFQNTKQNFTRKWRLRYHKRKLKLKNSLRQRFKRSEKKNNQ